MKKILNFAGRFIKGVADSSTGGMISALDSARKNKNNGVGNIDWPNIVGYIGGLMIIAGVVFGNITNEEGESLLKVWGKVLFFN